MNSLFSCTDEAADHHIDEELQVMFERFKEEAAKRQMVIDYESLGVSGYLTNIQNRGVVGQCQSFENGNASVLIEKNYWSRIDDLKKEFLIFHELGHCVLKRSHNNQKNSNGNCVSIMHSGEHVCEDGYGQSTRTQYLDELFNN